MANQIVRMRAITVRQPWAWALIYGGKDIENRDWRTKHRGTLAIHAAKGMTRRQYDDFCGFYRKIKTRRKQTVPAFEDLIRGAVIGVVEVVDCVEDSRSPWF